ncbi:MAG: peptide methionine sulfoxide reductase [Pseudomonadota bacterium]|jgi:peptide-methionine (S)-S-oxide reductase
MSSTHLNPNTLVLAGGCFWCLEAVYVRVKGVLDVESGYANGDAQRWPQPSYEQVCTGQTGYAEVVKLVYDPQIISTRALLEVFFHIHDPTTLNRQGNDVGTQYRSGIYVSNDQQRTVAQAVLADAQAQLSQTVVTELDVLRHYVAAEDEHQDYFEQHPYQGYCAWVVAPKVEKFQATFKRLLA